MAKNYQVFDLRQIREAMGSHYDPNRADEIKAQCEVCAKEGFVVKVSQNENECFICKTPVVWKGSKVWKRLYGSPTEVIRELNSIPPNTRSGEKLMELAGLDGWTTQADAQRWAKAVKMFGEKQMTNIAEYVTKEKAGYPSLRHAINIAKKKVRTGRKDGRKEAPELPDKDEDDLTIVT